jgi:hypothetical protein
MPQERFFFHKKFVNLYKKVVLLEQLSCDKMSQEISFCSPNSVNLDKKVVIANINLVIICLENDCCGEWNDGADVMALTPCCVMSMLNMN